MILVMVARIATVPREMKAADFKAKCLELMDVVARTGASVVITKRGVPVARLVPASESSGSVFGFAKGSFEETGDIVGPVVPAWRAREEEVALFSRLQPQKKRKPRRER
jgi:prevent-host-death family protein